MCQGHHYQRCSCVTKTYWQVWTLLPLPCTRPLLASISYSSFMQPLLVRRHLCLKLQLPVLVRSLHGQGSPGAHLPHRLCMRPMWQSSYPSDPVFDVYFCSRIWHKWLLETMPLFWLARYCDCFQAILLSRPRLYYGVDRMLLYIVSRARGGDPSMFVS